MMRRLGWPAVLGLAGLLWAAGASAADGTAPGGLWGSGEPWVVYCLDTARGVLQRTVAGTCQGQVVSPAEAAALEARLLAGRQQRLAKRTPPPVAPGRTLSAIGTGFFVADGPMLTDLPAPDEGIAEGNIADEGAAEEGIAGRSAADRGMPDAPIGAGGMPPVRASAGGLVLTNNHVIDGCAVVAVETTSGRTLPAAVAAIDRRNDLALLRTTAAAPATATFRGAAAPAAGSSLTIVGYPTRTLPPLQPESIPGTLLGSNSLTAGRSHLEIGAEIRSGSSGGPVLDDRGHVIGVVVAKIDTVAVFRQSGELLQGIGFAISDAVVQTFLARNGVTVHRKSTGRALSRDEVFAAAKPYVARIACWR